jgi:ABC-type phosphate/phosphonate transport system ATPase subunit
MIELLGLAMPASPGQWLFRRLSARVETPELIAVVSQDREARLALLDAITGRRIPTEGRLWVNGSALTRLTQARFRSRVVEIDLEAPLVGHRSLLWNGQQGHNRRHRLWRGWRSRLSKRARRAAEHALARVALDRFADERVQALPPEVQSRARIAQALTAQPEILVLREVEHNRALSEAADVLAALRVLVSCDRLTVFVSTAEPILVQLFAQRVLDIVDGALRFNGPPSTTPVPSGVILSRPLAATG